MNIIPQASQWGMESPSFGTAWSDPGKEVCLAFLGKGWLARNPVRRNEWSLKCENCKLTVEMLWLENARNANGVLICYREKQERSRFGFSFMWEQKKLLSNYVLTTRSRIKEDLQRVWGVEHRPGHHHRCYLGHRSPAEKVWPSPEKSMDMPAQRKYKSNLSYFVIYRPLHLIWSERKNRGFPLWRNWMKMK